MPATQSRYGLFEVGVGTVLWAVSLTVPPTLVPTILGELLMVTAWIVLPIGLYRDLSYLNASEADWQPRTRQYLLPAAVPFLAAFVGVFYLYRRLDRVGFR